MSVIVGVYAFSRRVLVWGYCMFRVYVYCYTVQNIKINNYPGRRHSMLVWCEVYGMGIHYVVYDISMQHMYKD